MKTRRFLMFILLTFLSHASAVHATHYTATWTGGTTGNGNVADNWDTTSYPDNDTTDTYDVLIDNNSSQNSTVSLNYTVDIDNLTIDGSDTLDMGSGYNLTLNGNLSNAGDLYLNSVGGYTRLIFDAGDAGRTGALTGGGTITLSDYTQNQIDNSGTGSFVLDTDNTIQGTGSILLDIHNTGLIHANVTKALTLDPDDTSTNTGTFKASNGATLVLQNGTFDKTNDGLMKATNGGTLVVDADEDGTGRWEANGGKSQLDAGVAVTTTGRIDVKNGGELELNDASISGSNLAVDSTGTLDINSTVSLSGDLSFAMTDEADWQWGEDSILEMTGGAGATIGDWDDWARLEVGGSDYGTDPETHTGDEDGFSDNFDLNELLIGTGAHIFLMEPVQADSKVADLIVQAN